MSAFYCEQCITANSGHEEGERIVRREGGMDTGLTEDGIRVRPGAGLYERAQADHGRVEGFSRIYVP